MGHSNFRNDRASFSARWCLARSVFSARVQSGAMRWAATETRSSGGLIDPQKCPAGRFSTGREVSAGL